jgi:23S rRNA (guanine745-N1)-methyltransferase
MARSMENQDPRTGLLACPVCGEALADAARSGSGPGDVGRGDAGSGGSARCPQGHSFDYARSGYLNLTGTGAGGRVGDTAEMVRARAEFLASGHYGPVAEAMAEQSAVAFCRPEGDKRQPPSDRRAPVVAEIGCGTGYYLDAVARRLGEAESPPDDCAFGAEAPTFGFDLSKAAVDRAARQHPDLRFAVADVEEGIPLRDSTADLVLSAFAPRPGGELARVVRPGGALVVALAGPRHLERLREERSLIGIHEDKLDRLAERLRPEFEPTGTTAVEYEMDLTAADARRLVLMGPNAWHRGDEAGPYSDLADLASVIVACYRRR